jgi:hypothetical protein
VRATLLLLLVPAVGLAAPKPGDDGTPEYRAAADLVRQLGDPKFAAREAAARKLVDMGAAAVPALRAGTASADEEVRSRSVALLPQAQAVGWKRRADAFLADPTGKHDLPLMAEWEKLAGKPDAGSRALYADMVKGGGPLMELAATDRRAAVAALAAQSKKLLDSMRVRGKVVEVPAGDIAAVLFVQAVLKDSPDATGSADRREPLYLLSNPSVAAALGARDTGPAFRLLVVAWIDSRPAEETMSALYFTLLTHRRPFAEADPVLIRLATRHKSAQIRWVALEALGKSGTKVAVNKLTELLTDTATMYDDVGGKDSPQQVRDCALAALVNGSGKKPVDYGLTSYMSANFWFGGTADGIALHLCGFKSAADRDAGFKKWRAEAAAKK